jgi:prophage antirepressor-like protein
MKAEIVKFYENDLTCIVEESGQILVVVKPICDALGLDSERAIKTLSDDEVLGAERSEQTVQVGNDQARKMICLPLEFINGWLFQIKLTNTMSEATKEKLIDYKRSCYKALFNHFFGNFKKQLEANEIEINLLTEINEMNEQKNMLTNKLKEKKALLEKIREERLKNEPTLFD